MLAIVPPGAVQGCSFERATKGGVVTFSAALAQGLIESAADLAAMNAALPVGAAAGDRYPAAGMASLDA